MKAIDINEVQNALNNTESLSAKIGAPRKLSVQLSSGVSMQASFFAFDLYQIYIKVKGQKLQHLGSYEPSTKKLNMCKSFAA